jgi:hypothetical protein
MALIWLVLSLIVLDLAALLFAVDTRPGFQHSAHPTLRSSLRPGVRQTVRAGARHAVRPGSRHSVGG